jgi:hypothetical protein
MSMKRRIAFASVGLVVVGTLVALIKPQVDRIREAAAQTGSL